MNYFGEKGKKEKRKKHIFSKYKNILKNKNIKIFRNL
jgi:hypothetical protein